MADVSAEECRLIDARDPAYLEWLPKARPASQEEERKLAASVPTGSQNLHPSQRPRPNRITASSPRHQ